MVGRLLQLDQAGPIRDVLLFFRRPWPLAILALLIVAAVAYTAFLYRREQTLSRGRRIGLGTVRAVIFALLLAILFEPVLGFDVEVRLPETVLVMLDTSESMAIRDTRTREEELRDAALALGRIPLAQATSAPLPVESRAGLTSPARIELAKGILRNRELDLLGRLGRDVKLHYFGFGERLEPASGEGAVVADSLLRAEPKARATRLGAAIEEAVSRYSGQSIAGVIVLTDGASNDGLEPLAAARLMQPRNIPLYPIGLGLPAPLDVRLQSLIAQDVVFANDRAPVRVQVASSGYANRSVNLTLTFDGRRVAERIVRLTGDPQFEEFILAPDAKAESAELQVSASGLPGEATADNNRLAKRIRVIDEKIKVLYIEGKPRWEYRYLRRVLGRDHRLDVKFLLTEGDRELAQTSPRFLLDFPEDASQAFFYDLVILGDVPANFFSPAQLDRIEQLVRERGGSFLMIGGLAGEQRSLAVRREKDLWDLPAVLIVLIALMGTEWLLRRKYDLI